MNLEDSIVEVDRLLAIGKTYQLHFEIAVLDTRPPVLVSAIVLGLDIGASDDYRKSYGHGQGSGRGYSEGVGFGDGDARGNGQGNGDGYGYGAGFGYGRGDGIG